MGNVRQRLTFARKQLARRRTRSHEIRVPLRRMVLRVIIQPMCFALLSLFFMEGAERSEAKSMASFRATGGAFGERLSGRQRGGVWHLDPHRQSK